MRRSTLHVWVQRCPSCGYCSRDASKFEDRQRSTLDAPEYRSQLGDPRYPELASTYICTGMLDEAAGQPDQAGWAYLNAAWVLDECKND